MSAYALSGSNLVSFDPTNPTVGITIGITGLNPGEALVGIDFRPQNGFLYGLGVVPPPTPRHSMPSRHERVWLRRSEGQSPLSMRAAIRSIFPTGNYGFDFNPAVDRMRVTTDTGLNFRINPNTGAPVDGNPGSAGIQSGRVDHGAKTVRSPVQAYTNNQPNATATTLYTLGSDYRSASDPESTQQRHPDCSNKHHLDGNPLDFSAVERLRHRGGRQRSNCEQPVRPVPDWRC